MLKSFPKIAIAVAIWGLSGISFADDGGGGGGGSGSGGTFGRPIYFWTCRASVRGDESGMFWLGIGKQRVEAQFNAYDKCQYFSGGQACFVDCEPTL